jgi:hypothetical protein
MAVFKPFVPGVEVNGETVCSILEGMGAARAKGVEILAKYQIENPKPGQWFKQQAWLDAFKEIAEKIGPATLFSIGQRIPENAKFPPAIDSLEKALSAIDVAYHMNHRGGEIGHYVFEKSGEKAGKMTCKNPYPCFFDKGIIDAMAKRFRPKNSFPQIKHDDSAPCRTKGAESCIYLISW